MTVLLLIFFTYFSFRIGYILKKILLFMYILVAEVDTLIRLVFIFDIPPTTTKQSNFNHEYFPILK